jgi:hypothetical protein
MAGYSDYYSTIARAVSGLPGKTDEARGAVYELARTALQKRLSAFDPPISDTDLAIELFALEAAIQRVETESRFSNIGHGSLRDKLDDNITAGGDRVKAAITACLTQGLEFIQRTRLTVPGRRIYNIFGGRRWITKYPQIRIALRLLVAAVIGMAAGIFLYWMTAEK